MKKENNSIIYVLGEAYAMLERQLPSAFSPDSRGEAREHPASGVVAAMAVLEKAGRMNGRINYGVLRKLAGISLADAPETLDAADQAVWLSGYYAELNASTCLTIANRRKKLDMTQVELAKKIGVSRASLSLWEAGIRRPSAKYIAMLAEFFQCEEDEL